MTLDGRTKWDELADYVAFTLLVVALLSLWYWGWKKPQDVMLESTLECLDERQLDMTEENWTKCWRDVVVKKGER